MGEICDRAMVEAALKKIVEKEILSDLQFSINTMESKHTSSKVDCIKCKITLEEKEATKNILIYHIRDFTTIMEGGVNFWPTLTFSPLTALRLSQGNDTLSAIDKILFDVSPEICPLFPKLCVLDSENMSIALEDLAEEKFKFATSISSDGFDLGKCYNIIRSLASIHGASQILFKRNPNIRDNISESVPPTFLAFKHLSRCLEWSLKLADNLNQLEGNFQKECKIQNSASSVINIGSLSLDTIMMRYRGCGTWDVRFLPQHIVLNSPVIDLIDIIFRCLKVDIMFLEIDTIIEMYHLRYTEVCLLLGETPNFTIQQLKNEMWERSTHAFLLFCNRCHFDMSVDKDCFLKGLSYFKDKLVFSV